jgi:hypothetical protein
VNTLKRGRADELAMHPTVKPVLLVADAIKDVSKRKGIVLDPFCGSGTTIIAAEKTGRRARAIELDTKVRGCRAPPVGRLHRQDGGAGGDRPHL